MSQKLILLFCAILFVNGMHSQTNWELLNPKPSSYTGKDIEFVTNNIGFIITDRELLETIDSGNTWTKKQTISSGNDMAFFGATGFIVGNNGYVLKSEDNGANWAQISTGFTDSFNTVNIIDLDNIILSSSDIYYGKYDIVKTSDGGLTWEKLSIPNLRDTLGIPDFEVIKTFFTSALVGHAICTGGAILKTIDGGQNWYVTMSTNITPTDFFTIYFINENVGFATREHESWFKTTDGGETWNIIFGVEWPIYDFNFVDENNGFAVGDLGKIYKTNDGGDSWTSLGSSGINLYGVHFLDSNVGFAIGERGRIIKTINGGSTWTQYSPTYSDVGKVQFIDANIGYTNPGNSFFKTIDGGNTWSSVGYLEDSYRGIGFTFLNEDLGYATTGDSVSDKIFKTTDGGASWVEIINLPTIVSMFFLDENNGFISGGNTTPKLYKTTDGGANWTQISDLDFDMIKFVNDMVGYGKGAVNSQANNAMYKTTDGGVTWNLGLELQEYDNINTFNFIDENNGYLVGDQGLIYKTNDGGATWQQLSAPSNFKDYFKVKFYSKNVGYIADDGMIYKTMNGGESWKYMIGVKANSIEIFEDKIFLAGTYGKIYRGDIDYDSVVLYAKPAEEISNTTVKLTGNITSNGGDISSIEFEYGTDYPLGNSVSTIPNYVASGESLNVSVDITGLNQNTKYYYRLKVSSNSTNYTSPILNFTTLNDYEIVTNPSYHYIKKSTTAEVSGSITSNKNDITNIEFEYGTSIDALNNSITGTPTFVIANTTETITANLNNLEPNTQYFIRLKASHQGETIYGEIQSFATTPEYYISLYNPIIDGNEVTFYGNISALYEDITNIAFEYGTLNYENQISANPSQIVGGTGSAVNATLSGLDTDSTYYLRLKMVQKGETIYSDEKVFNFTGDIIMVNAGIEQIQSNSLELKGLINSYGAFLTNIQFEYDVTNNFDAPVTGKLSSTSASTSSLIYGTPNYVSGNDTNLITATIPNPLSNQTYYYRLAATYNGSTIYSDIYQFTTGTLSTDDFVSEGQIFIYPNPAKDFVNIKPNNAEKIKSIEFYDISGKLVYIKNISDTSDVKIGVSNFQKGLYFLKVNFENMRPIFSKVIID